jgi:hypothetical protein
MQRISVFAILSAFILSAIIFLINSDLSNAGGYFKCGQQSFIADGTWQKVTCTVAPNVEWDPGEGVDSRAVSITGYAIFEATGTKEVRICEGNTWNAAAVFLVMEPGVPRITNLRNKLMHQEGVYIKVDSTTTTITAETWMNLW